MNQPQVRDLATCTHCRNTHLQRDAMSLVLLKPVCWNSQGYLRPSGERGSGGYPAEFGFGHEEWNNAPGMSFQHRGEPYRAFHSEPAGTAALDHPGDTVVVMYASEGGEQRLVGIAGRATSLGDDDSLRRQIRSACGMADQWKEAWALPSVRAKFNGDRADFLEKWRDEVPHKPAWIAPASHFLWLDQPVAISAASLVGKSKFLTMFSSYTRGNMDLLAALLETVPASQRSAPWFRLRELSSDASAAAAEDVNGLLASGKVTTSILRWVACRLGQGRFRSRVMQAWDHRCAVTGCAREEMLRASHIKPWRDSTSAERLDGNNGLLLTANLDALFDAWMLSFDPSGLLVLAPGISRQELGLQKAQTHLLRPLSRAQQGYMDEHRAVFRARHGK